MTTPVDYHPHPDRSGRSCLSTAVIVLLLLLGLGALFRGPLLAVLMTVGAAVGSSSSVAPADISRSVAASLTRWGVPGPVPDRGPARTDDVHSIASRITGVKGYTESSGIHGDGTDWYEVDLSPDLAAELRAALARSPKVKKQSGYLPRYDSAPRWWPKAAPADAQCYSQGTEYLVLPQSGTRAWFLRVRT